MKQENDILARYLAQQKEILGPNMFIESTSNVVHSPATLREQKESIMSINPTWNDSQTLPILHDAIHTCMECRLGSTRNSFVFGSGNPNADIMIIGEAPGADEDAQGLPFVGAAGKLLTKILEAIEFSRDEVYIANIIKCRPPENRRPEKEIGRAHV